ncbi:laccase-15-like [Wolffia australiana]
MGSGKLLFFFFIFHGIISLTALCAATRYVFKIEEANYTRLCVTKTILTVNGQFPGPTISATRGDTIFVRVLNRASQNITVHWHGVTQQRNPWSDGPAYITQCPIKPGGEFHYKIVFSHEQGTAWWHAHSDWARATVHGPIVIYPKPGSFVPFLEPDAHIPIVLGEWWKRDVNAVLQEMLRTGGAPNVSDAFTINGQPGDFYPCSDKETTTITVEFGRRYLLHLVNAALNEELFFAIARHRLLLVGADGSYLKPYLTEYVMISPGQTMDLILEANQCSSEEYYMAARAFSSAAAVAYDNTTATAVLKYSGEGRSGRRPVFPGALPASNDTVAVTRFTAGLRGLGIFDRPEGVPFTVDAHILTTISINELPCPEKNCEGPNGTRLAASMNNISFVTPQVDVLGAYYRNINGVIRGKFPSKPPLFFNFTADDLPPELLPAKKGTKVKFIDYGASVELVFQGTSLVAGLNHPMHLHGYNFYVVGWGFGNYNRKKHTPLYNLVDPPLMNTFGVPRNGWAAIRFRALNPGVWFMHCHLERHMTWGMDTVFIVKDGKRPEERMLPPPPDMPPC